MGPSFAADAVPDVVEEILNTYLDLRQDQERFIDTYRRVGIQPLRSAHMLNPALQVLAKDGSIADNTYQPIAEDGVIPAGDVVVTTAQLDQLTAIQGKKRYTSR